MPHNHLTPDECKELLAAIWHNSLNGMAIVEEDGRFKLVNPAFCQLVEYTETELQDMKFQDITIPTDIRADVMESKKVVDGDQDSYDMTKTYITKSRKFLGILLRATAVRMNGNFMYFISEAAPLSAPTIQKEMEQHIKAAKSRNRFLYAIKAYWVQILFAVGLLAYFTKELISATNGGQ